NEKTGNYIIAYRGTEPASYTDWLTDLKQALGFKSTQYANAIEIAGKYKEIAVTQKVKVELVGHSLGGGLATAAAIVTDLPATTFNPAGVAAETIKRYGKSFNSDHDNSLITAYTVEGEILSSIQNDSQLSGLMPPTVGNNIVLVPPMILAARHPL